MFLDTNYAPLGVVMYEQESEEGSTIISPRAAEVIQKLMGSFKSCGTLRTEKEACAMINQVFFLKRVHSHEKRDIFLKVSYCSEF